jgi:prepilin-type N-terminal cleavage/methylation domain-containing protein
MSINQTLSQIKKSYGFTLIELIVTISLIAVLSDVALNKLFWYQGQAEKVNMEYTASMIKSGLWMSAANLMMAERGGEIPALLKQNPFNLLAEKPANYLGEINSDNANTLKGGNWYFDSSKQQIIYIVGQRQDFTPTIADDFSVRYGMKVLYAEVEITKDNKVEYVSGITLVPLSHYKWQ